MKNMITVDLHTHTQFSDGELSLHELLSLCQRRGVEELAITDHDTVINMMDYESLETVYGIKIIPAVEVTASIPGMHILGYGIKDFSKMEEKFDAIKESNVSICEETISLLRKAGVDISVKRVEAIKKGRMITKRDIARYVVSQGKASNNKEVYDKYMGRGMPCYIPINKMPYDEVISLISECGGFSVLAHPVSLGEDTNYFTLFSELKELGLSGVETHTTQHTKAQIIHFSDMSEKFGFIQTCGTDFHRYSMSFLPGVYVEKKFLQGFHEKLKNH